MALEYRPQQICLKLMYFDYSTISGHETFIFRFWIPSCPSSLLPHEKIFPEDVRKQVWLIPHATCLIFSSWSLSLTTIGLYSLIVMKPIPSWPLSPLPQENTSPFTERKQEWFAPQDTSLTCTSRWVLENWIIEGSWELLILTPIAPWSARPHP